MQSISFLITKIDFYGQFQHSHLNELPDSSWKKIHSKFMEKITFKHMVQQWERRALLLSQTSSRRKLKQNYTPFPTGPSCLNVG